MLRDNDLVDLGIPQMKRPFHDILCSLWVRNSVLKVKEIDSRSFMIISITSAGILLYYSSLTDTCLLSG